MDRDSKSGRILVHLALGLNQHSKLTTISVGFINMERHKSMHTHTKYTSTHTHTDIRNSLNFLEYVSRGLHGR